MNIYVLSLGTFIERFAYERTLSQGLPQVLLLILPSLGGLQDTSPLWLSIKYFSILSLSPFSPELLGPQMAEPFSMRLSQSWGDPSKCTGTSELWAPIHGEKMEHSSSWTVFLYSTCLYYHRKWFRVSLLLSFWLAVLIDQLEPKPGC